MPKKSLNILLIDDDKDELASFDAGLGKIHIGYNLFYYSNGVNRIIEYIADKQPDIIFLDINMPGKKGIQFLAELKANKLHQHIPVIMFSVSQREEDIRKSYEAGAHYYLIKPYSQANLIESLKKIFKTDWTTPQPIPPFENFVINLAFA